MKLLLSAVVLLAVARWAEAAAVSLYCVDLTPSPFCRDGNTARSLLPEKICSSSNSPVTSAAGWNANTFATVANASCPKTPALYTKNIFCQTSYIPCTEGLACPSYTELCYSLCLSGGKTGSHTFLSPDDCQTSDATTFCNARVTSGEVASVTDTSAGKCVGLSYYNTYHMMTMIAKKPFQPRACRARYPIFNVDMVNFNADMRVEFMKSLSKKLNRIWGYTNKTDGTPNEYPYMWERPKNIRLRRVQLQKGVPQVYVELKEFCMIPTRTGKPDYTLKYNQDVYCDKVSVSPDDVYANLTDLLDTKKEDRGMMIGQFNVRKGSDPGWPTYCYTWQPEETPKIPGWVWALTAVGSMCCLLSVLILQHRYRNRASYVRLNEKLRSYV